MNSIFYSIQYSFPFFLFSFSPHWCYDPFSSFFLVVFCFMSFPSISYYFHIPNFFLFFGISLSNLEKIGIDKKVICYHNISNLLWEKDVLCAWKRKWISKTLQILGRTASNLQTFFSIFFLTLEQFFLTVR